MYLTEKVLKIIPLVNILFLFNVLHLDIPAIGFLEIDMIKQGLEALPVYALYLLACLTNSFMLLATFTEDTHIDIYDVFVYSVVFIALQTIASIYGFHLMGLKGLKLSLAVLFIVIPAVYVYQIHKKEIQSIALERDRELPLVLVLSITTFFFYYFYVLYDHYSDQAVMLANVNSILYRGNLEPYYKATAYYPAVGGFYIAAFIYTTGLNNTILASTLSFTIAYMFLPIIVYRLVKLLVNNGSIALVVSVMAVHADGLGILAYPIYKNIIDYFLSHPYNVIYNWNAWYVLSFQLSPKTCSLYASSISYLWFTPYKVFALLASVTSVAMFLYPQQSTYKLILAGILLSISLTYPKATPLILLSFMLLWGLGRISTLKDVLILILTGIIGLAPLTYATTYKLIGEFIHLYLPSLYSLPAEKRTYVMCIVKYVLRTYLTHSLIFATFLLLLVLIIYYRMKTSSSTESLSVMDVFSPRTSALSSASLFITLSLIVLVFIIYYIYDLLPYPLSRLVINSRPLFIVRYLIMRYHIMVVPLFLVPLFFRINLKLLLSILLMLSSIYLLGWIPVALPIPILILGIPILHYFIKQKYNIVITISLLTFLVLSVLTSGLYGIPIISTKVDSIYEDMPYVIGILLNFDPGTKVYSGSYYDYFIVRTLSFAQLRLSNSLKGTDLCLIDKQYNIKTNLRSSNTQIFYIGKRLMLIKLGDRLCPN